MTWGFFTITHIITILLAIAIGIGMHFLLRNKSEKTQTIVLGTLSFLGIITIIYHLVTDPMPLSRLPLQLCSLNAMMLPVAVFTKNKIVNNLLLVWALGALIAIVLNNEAAGFSLLSWEFFFYYFPHVVECFIPVLMFTLKRAKLDVKCIIPTISITLVVYTIIHFVNLWINANVEGVFVNYMFSLQPNNPVLEIFMSIIPHSYWYMYLAVPVLVVYLSIIYCVQIKNLIFKKKPVANLTKEETVEVKEN